MNKQTMTKLTRVIMRTHLRGKGSDGWSVGNAVSNEDADSVHVNLRF